MKKLLAILALASATWLAAAPASAAIIVTFEPASQHVNVGDTVTVDLRISGLDDEVLSGFDLNVLFDSGILSQGGSVTFFNSALGGPWSLNADFNAGNRGLDGFSLTFDDDALAALQTDGSFVFASLSWTAIGDGFTLLQFGLDPDFERNIVGRNALSLVVDFGSACVSVGTGQCQVPEPAALALLGIALAAGVMAPALRRRRLHASV